CESFLGDVQETPRRFAPRVPSIFQVAWCDGVGNRSTRSLSSRGESPRPSPSWSRHRGQCRDRPCSSWRRWFPCWGRSSSNLVCRLLLEKKKQRTLGSTCGTSRQ